MYYMILERLHQTEGPRKERMFLQKAWVAENLSFVISSTSGRDSLRISLQYVGSYGKSAAALRTFSFVGGTYSSLYAHA